MNKRIIIALAALFGLMLELQHEIDVEKSDFLFEIERPFVPPLADWMRAASLGYHTLVADAYWIKEIQYQAAMDERHQVPQDLYAMGDFITDLDPKYHMVYYFTGLNLIFEGGDKDQIVAILEKGEKNCPDYWKTPFLLGFYYFIVLQDFDKAAEHVEKAYQINRHWVYGQLAARLRAQGGSPELGIQFLQQMIEQTPDEFSKMLFQKRILQLRLKIVERDLTRLVEKYREQQGENPYRLEDLVTAGFINRIPDSPLEGYRLVYDHDSGTVNSDPPLDMEAHDPWIEEARKKRARKAAAEGE